MSDYSSDDDEDLCPLCVEEMDISDKNFKPCPCGYQICQFCYNNIKQSPELNGRCPGCRRLYDDSTVEYTTLTAEEYKQLQSRREKKERDKKQKEKEKKENELANKKHLSGIRVVQKNLVYVTGLNPPANNGIDDLTLILKSDKYFGRYGKILKIVINNKKSLPVTNPHHANPGIVVYVTYVKKEDALRCINDMDGSQLDGRTLRAAHGTTKYCSSYLRGHPCHNPNCMFLHEPGEEADSFTRKDLSTQQGIKMMNKVNDEVKDSGFGSNDETKTENTASESTVLPAAANWAKNTASPSTNNVGLTNVSAFPSLGEIKDKHPTPKIIKRKKQLADDSDNDSDSALQFLGEVTESLTNLAIKKQDLVVKFNKDFENGQVLPLFEFNNKVVRKFNNIDQEKVLARQVIEKYLLKPIKNYHLAYTNHPIQQQMKLPEQQELLQQLQRQREDKGFQDHEVQMPPQPQPQMPPQTQQAPPGLAKPDSSSSQLLSQLMNGRR